MGLEVFVVGLGVLSVVLVLGGFVLLFRHRERERGDLASVWRAYAARRGLEFVAPRGEWPVTTMPAIEGGVSRSGLSVHALRVGEALRTRAELRTGHAVLARVLASTDRRDVTDPIAPGDLADGTGFHVAYAVQATPAALAAKLLGPEVRRALAAFHTGAGAVRLEHDRGTVALEWSGGETNPARLDEALRVLDLAAAAVASAFFGRAA